MSTIAQAFELLRPWWTLALPLLAAIWLVLRRQHELPASYRRLAAPHLLVHLLVPPRERPWLRPADLLLPVGLLTILALAGPSWRNQPSPFAEDQAAIVAVLRVDESMQATDIAPSRLARARHKLRDLAALRGGAPLGLIAYRGSAHLVAPITRDPDVVEQMAAALEPSVMPVEGDALVEALSLAQSLLTEAKSQGSILLIADAVSPDAAARLAAESPAGNFMVQVLAMLPGPERSAASGIEAAAQALAASLEVASVDDRDVRRLASRAEAFAATPGADQTVQPRDEGWALVPLVALGVLLWARRGWSIRWD